MTHPSTAAFILVERECRLSIASSTMKEFKRSVTYDRKENGEENGGESGEQNKYG